jgi:hypothetical protein
MLPLLGSFNANIQLQLYDGYIVADENASKCREIGICFSAMMRWIRSKPFVLSANIHAGAVVASYPFDDSAHHRQGTYSTAPDDDFFKYVSKIYANSHRFMSRGKFCGDNFRGGITNGAKWYDVPGGMQASAMAWLRPLRLNLMLYGYHLDPVNNL